MSRYDFFISHAGADKAKYIDSLVSALQRKGLSVWLDSAEIGWGDSIALKISEGLRESRFVILCLSRNFLRRPWPETELGAALAVQNADGIKRVLPLILDSKQQVLRHYPILAGIDYREIASGIEQLSEELASLARRGAPAAANLRVRVESVHTPQVYETVVEPRVSVRLLAETLSSGLGLRQEADTGSYKPFRVRWVLVDVRAEETWQSLGRDEQRRIWAVVMSDHGLRISYSDRDRLESIAVYDGIVFHLSPVEDEEAMGRDSAAKYGY